LIRLSEEGARKLAEERMEDWSKDQEEYEEKPFRDVRERLRKARSATQMLEEAQASIARGEPPPVSENLRRRRTNPEAYPNMVPKEHGNDYEMMDRNLAPVKGDEYWEDWVQLQLDLKCKILNEQAAEKAEMDARIKREDKAKNLMLLRKRFEQEEEKSQKVHEDLQVHCDHW
jgi:hypothetical protein